MNNLDKDIAEAIGEISKVATLINMQGKHHVFINMSGHVQWVEIKIYKNGWEQNKVQTLGQQIDFGVDEDDSKAIQIQDKKDALDTLKVIRDTLYKFLKNEQVSMKNRDYDVEEIRHYKFY